MSPQRNDPHPAFRFEVRIDDFRGGFSECSGLGAEIEVMEYREGGVNDHVHQFVTTTRQQNLLLRRGIVNRELYDWHAAVVSGDIVTRDGSIRVLDGSGQAVVMEWRFRSAFPVKWLGPALDALESRVAVEVLELAHDGLTRVV